MRVRATTCAVLLLAAGLLAAAPATEPAAPPAAPAAAAAPTDRSDRSDPAAPPANSDPADLGRGLRYFRVAALAADLPTLEPALAAGPLVLDLRAAQGDTVSTVRLRELLQHHATAADAGRPLFVLLAADTPEAIRAAVPAAPAILTLGCAGPGFAPALAVPAEPDLDRAAVAALAAGRPARELIEEKLDKPRFDEARLARAHANGRRGDDAGAPPPAAEPKDSPDAAAAPEAPVKDLVLQRAVFLHRALLALGRIPQKD